MFFNELNASIYFYGLPVDLRKGCEGLAYISTFIVNSPLDNTYFIFLNRKRNRLKILHWSSSRFFYWFARSQNGVFAPKFTQTSLINFEELKRILNGDFPERLKAVSE